MVKYLLACVCASSLCFGSNVQKSGTIESDFTIKHPEEFCQEQLVLQYLNKAEAYLSSIAREKSLDLVTIQKQKRDAKKDKNLYGDVDAKLGIVTNINARLKVFLRHLQFLTADAYYSTINAEYFNDLKEYVNKESDPLNILKIDVKSLEKNRNIFYQYLAQSFPGKKSAAQVSAMSYQDILKGIEELKQQALKKGLTVNSSYIKLLKEMGAFFDNELEKEEYDAFVAGPKALTRLIIPVQRTRNGLTARLQNVYDYSLVPARQKLNKIQEFLKPLLEK